MTILISSSEGGETIFQSLFADFLPSVPCEIYPDISDKNTITYAVVWQHPHGNLKNYPNLKAILSMAAGVDHILSDPELPNVPIIRLADPFMADDMAMHCLYWTINFQRHYYHYQKLQQQKCWEKSLRNSFKKTDFSIAVLGIGVIGKTIAKQLLRNGYKVNGWASSPKSIDTMECFYGANQLAACISDCKVLISCLPSTEDTFEMIDSSVFNQLSTGAFFINVSRGNVVNDSDLLQALENKQIASAALDVFHIEPLPGEHPFWEHPNVFITPHISGPTRVRSAAGIIADNIKRIEAGKAPFPLVDPNKHY